MSAASELDQKVRGVSVGGTAKPINGIREAGSGAAWMGGGACRDDSRGF